MATVTSTLTDEAKNELLRGLNSMQLHDEGETANKIAAVNSQGTYASNQVTFTFGSPTGGAIGTSENIIIEVIPGQTVTGIRYFKSNQPHGDPQVIEPVSITPTAFPYGGKIIITQITVTLT